MKNFQTSNPEKCDDCHVLTYPPQGFCRSCLSENTAPIKLPASGHVMAATRLHHSFEEEIKSLLPLSIAAVDMGTGCVVFALTAENMLEAGTAVSLDHHIWAIGNLLTVVKEQL